MDWSEDTTEIKDMINNLHAFREELSDRILAANDLLDVEPPLIDWEEDGAHIRRLRNLYNRIVDKLNDFDEAVVWIIADDKIEARVREVRRQDSQTGLNGSVVEIDDQFEVRTGILPGSHTNANTRR